MAVDPPNDVAAFMIVAPKGSRPIPVARANPNVGSTLEYVGFRYRSWTSTASGYPRYSNNDHSLAGVPSRSQSGDSGGGVLHKGQLVGVITGFVGRREHDTGPSLRPIRTLLSDCAPWSLLRPPHRPRQPPRPVDPPTSAKPEKPPSDELAGLREQLTRLEASNAALAKQLEEFKSTPGPGGPRGADGPRGPEGQRGPGGVVGPAGQGVNIDDLAAVITEILDARQPVAGVAKPPGGRKMELVDVLKVKGLVPSK
jgi:hypothetical protein